MSTQNLLPETINKLREIQSGEVVTVSDDEFNLMAPHLANDVASIPNPHRCGVLDALRVGRCNAPEIRAYRLQHGLEAQ